MIKNYTIYCDVKDSNDEIIKLTFYVCLTNHLYAYILDDDGEYYVDEDGAALPTRDINVDYNSTSYA